MSVRPGSQNARLLDVLADGEWHVSTELHERCGYMRTNSRIAELRTHGHRILGESVPGKTGTDGYRYRLLDVPTPVDLLCAHGCGWEASVEHADGRLLCRECYAAETGGEGSADCPTCAPPKWREDAQLTIEVAA